MKIKHRTSSPMSDSYSVKKKQLQLELNEPLDKSTKDSNENNDVSSYFIDYDHDEEEATIKGLENNIILQKKQILPHLIQTFNMPNETDYKNVQKEDESIDELPLVEQARSDLLKQIRIYLELRLFVKLNNVICYNSTSELLLRNNKSDHQNIYIDEDDPSNNVQMQKKYLKKNKSIQSSINAEFQMQSISTNKPYNLKPLLPIRIFFDNFQNVYENEPIIGREWLFKEIDKGFESNQFLIISGNLGTGKSKIVQSLFRLSSLFQNSSQKYFKSNNFTDNPNFDSFNLDATISLNVTANVQAKYLASNLAAIHICLSNDYRTLKPYQFIVNLAWSLTQFDHLNKINATVFHSSSVPVTKNLYMHLLHENNSHLLKILTNSDSLKLDSEFVLKKCVIEPIENLIDSNLLKISYFYVLIDDIDNCLTAASENTLSSNNLFHFLLKNAKLFPKWFKFALTIRDEQTFKQKIELYKLTNFKLISLNPDNIFTNTTNYAELQHEQQQMFKDDSNNSFKLLKHENFQNLSDKKTHFYQLKKEIEYEQQTFKQLAYYLNKDLTDYITYRINKSIEIQKNILYFNNVTSVNSLNQLTNSSSFNYASLGKTKHSSNNFESNTHLINASKVHTHSPLIGVSKFDSNFQQKFIQHLIQLGKFNYLFIKLTLDLIEKGQLIIKSPNFRVLPQSFDDLLKLYFNLKFKSRSSYERLGMHIISLILVSFKPLNLNDIYESMNSGSLSDEKIKYDDLLDQINNLDTFIEPFFYFETDINILKSNRACMYTFNHNRIKEWFNCFLLSSISNNNNNLSSVSSSLKSLTDTSTSLVFVNNFDLNSIHYFLLAIRFFKSDELKHRLKYLNNNQLCIEIMIEQINYLLKSVKHLDSIIYLLNLYVNVENIYSEILVSSEFLAYPHVELMKMLLKLKANYNASVLYFNNSPFVCVLARLGHIRLLEVLINHLKCKFQVNYHDLSENTFKSSIDKVRLNCVDRNGTNCLCYAIQHCDQAQIDCVRFIVENSADPIEIITQLDSNGYCALTYLCLSKKDPSHILKYLIEKIQANDPHKSLNYVKQLLLQTLVLSSLNGNKNCLSYLIDFITNNTNLTISHISIDSTDSLKGETALTAACISGNKSLCELLVEKGNASIDITNSKSWSPLLCAVKSSVWEIVEYLLVKDISIINKTDRHGRTALILAASEGNIAILDILIEKGANLSSYDRDGLSALSWACLKGHYNAALKLLNNGVNVNHTDDSGRTPLDLATFYGNVRLVELLLDRGAIIDHVDKIGMRPLDRAIGCRNVPAVICFLKKGANIGPATWTMAQGKPEILITLLNKLVEDGNTLYKKGNYVDAMHRYSYTLKKFPKDASELVTMPDNIKAIREMRFNLTLNLARCHRKLEQYEISIDLCSKAIDLNENSYEAFYSRARAKRDLREYKSALDDLYIAYKLCSTNSDIKKLINKINEEINFESSSSTLKRRDKNHKHSTFLKNHLVESPPL